MEATLITSDNFITNNWSGGTTTQFFMNPPTADYKKLNFDFRLSMATVVIDTSVFTSLPGISRTLMVLDGEITLDHKNKHSKHLTPLDSDHFEGGWKTTSTGKCTDFNLMTSGNTTGKLAGHTIKENNSIQYPSQDIWDWVFIYNYSGKATITVNEQIYTIHQSDLLVIKKPTNSEIDIKAIEDSILVFSEIANKK
ncbi:HutD/Ves family protein [Aquimarina sediminis]|uniref:HutD/Ves family protein n=1 Tax=Aquimarina sediminis TaxID=2070536 RepID=UPI000CA03EBF|nr:HutD family protein [Aquimarina sediminis]